MAICIFVVYICNTTDQWQDEGHDQHDATNGWLIVACYITCASILIFVASYQTCALNRINVRTLRSTHDVRR